MKKLFQFSLPFETEVDQTEESKNEAGETVKITKKVKETIEKKFFIKKPNRSLIDSARLFYGKKFSQAVQEGLLPAALLQKRFNNDKGVFSEDEKENFGKLLVDLVKKQNDVEKLSAETNKTEEQQAQIEKLTAEITSINKELIDFEQRQNNLYLQTSENYARTQTEMWWTVNLAYQENDKEECFFGEGNYEEKLQKYDELIEKEDVFTKRVISFFTNLITFWFVASTYGEVKTEDFSKIFNDLLKEI